MNLATVALVHGPDGEGVEEYDPSWFVEGFFCSGVLIAPDVALTAAHCVDACGRLDLCDSFGCDPCEPTPVEAEGLFVLAGARDIDDIWDAEAVAVREVIIHPEYLPSVFWPLQLGTCEEVEPGSFVCTGAGLGPIADIAVLRLSSSVTRFPPIALSEPSLASTATEGLMQGYGRLRPPGGDTIPSEPISAPSCTRPATPSSRSHHSKS